MKKLFVGIDISKDVFDYCFLDQENKVLARGRMDNNEKGIAQFYSLLKSFNEYDVWICMEHTGYYGTLLSTKFSEYELCFSLINPLELTRSMGITRGKTDAVDAYRIATYALSNSYKLKPYELPDQQLQKLKVMMSMRNRYAKILVQLKNGLKSIKIAAKTIELQDQIKQNELMITQQEKAIKQLEKEMLQIIKNNEELSQTYKKISSVIGVGNITALKCIIETRNFQLFDNPRKFACHCGLAPFKHESGTSVKGKTKTSPLSNKSLKAILFKAAASAIQHDPQLKAYYNRKINEGKHRLSVLNAVANKIVLRIFAVFKRDELFVKLAA
jgi:transposase